MAFSKKRFLLRFKDLTKLLVLSFKELRRNEPLRMAGATAFFTTFALPPILIILIQIIGLVVRIENLRDKFFVRLAQVLGRQSAAQVRETFLGFKSLAKNWVVTIVGFLFLVFVATTLFKVIKDSLNQLWNVRVSTKRPIKFSLESRAISLVVILLAGVLFIGSMLAEGLESFLREYTGELPENTADFVNIVINSVISVVIVTCWFAVLFKVLPDAKTSWKVVLNGGLFTGILFTAGKLLIRTLLLMGNLNTVFGASSSFVLLLLFVFYSSFILYFGACFTKAYATLIGDPVKPAHYATSYKVVEVNENPVVPHP